MNGSWPWPMSEYGVHIVELWVQLLLILLVVPVLAMALLVLICELGKDK